MKRTILTGLLTGLAAVLSGCNATSNNTNDDPPPNANLQGEWEIIATSTTNPGVVSVIDVVLGSGGAWSFQGKPTFYPYDCQSVLILDQNDPLTLTTSGSQVTGTLTDGTAVFNFTGQTSAQTPPQQFSGTYSSATGNSTSCQGDGTFIASHPVSLTGNYLGTSGYLTGASLSVTQSGGAGGPVGHDVTAVLSVAGTYSGSSMGNSAVVSSGSDVFYIWWDASTTTLWVWSQADGASGFIKQ